MNGFNEHDETGQSIMYNFEYALKLIEDNHDITFLNPKHDIARRFLNEIKEFEP